MAAANGADEHFQRALDYRLQGNIDAAQVEYRRALELDPNFVDAHANLGVLLLQDRGDVDGAISEFVTALGIDPGCAFCQSELNQAVDLRNSKAEDNIARGNSYYRVGQLNHAVGSYRVAIYLDPTNADAHNSLAWTLYRLGKLAEARAEVEEALRLKPNDAEYINTLACVLLDSGDVQGAIKQFQSAIVHSQKPNPADLYGLATALLSTGDKSGAIENFKQALKDDPNYADANYLRDKIGMSVHTLASHDLLLTISGTRESSATK
jgi:Tfp pilus assembly protein PilF